MGEERKVYKVLVAKPEGKRTLGRPRRRWEDGFRMDIREIALGGVDCIRLAQGSDRRRAVGSEVLNLRILAPRSQLVSSAFSEGTDSLAEDLVNVNRDRGSFNTPVSHKVFVLPNVVVYRKVTTAVFEGMPNCFKTGQCEAHCYVVVSVFQPTTHTQHLQLRFLGAVPGTSDSLEKS
jgi:hypothetical protein